MNPNKKRPFKITVLGCLIILMGLTSLLITFFYTMPNIEAKIESLKFTDKFFENMLFWGSSGMLIILSLIVFYFGYRLLKGKYYIRTSAAAVVIFILFVPLLFGDVPHILNNITGPQFLIAAIALLLPHIVVRDAESQEYFEEFEKYFQNKSKEVFEKEKKYANYLLVLGMTLTIASFLQFLRPQVPKTLKEIHFIMLFPIGAFIIFVALFYYKGWDKKLGFDLQ